MTASMHASNNYPCFEERTAWMDAVGMVHDVFNMPDSPANRELLVLANRNYLKASEDLMAAWDRLEEE